MTFNAQPYKVKKLSAYEVIEWWPFFQEGVEALRDPRRARSDLSDKEWLNQLVHIALQPSSRGCVMLFTSKNDKPLGFMAVIEDSETIELKTALIYAGYSNEKYENAPVTGLAEVEKWARENGYSRLHLQTRRMNGASVKFFEKKLGFSPLCVVYEKEL